MFARNSTSASREAAPSFGWKASKTPSCVSSVSRELRSQPYSPAQKKLLPPATCSTSSVFVPRVASTARAAASKSSPTGPTTRTSSKKDAASAKCVAAPPTIRSRLPNGVVTVSKAMEPTTVMGIGGACCGRRRAHLPWGWSCPAEGWDLGVVQRQPQVARAGSARLDA